MLSALWGHITLWFRGCSHPKMEPTGSFFTEVDGEEIVVFVDECTVCGLTIVSTT